MNLRYLRSIRCGDNEASGWLVTITLRDRGYVVTDPVDNGFGYYHVYIVARNREEHRACGVDGCWYRRGHRDDGHSSDRDIHVFRGIAPDTESV